MDLRPRRRPQVPNRPHHQPRRAGRRRVPDHLGHLLLHVREQGARGRQAGPPPRGVDGGGAGAVGEPAPELSVLDVIFVC